MQHHEAVYGPVRNHTQRGVYSGLLTACPYHQRTGVRPQRGQKKTCGSRCR
jgi:hypothetical protein